MASSFLLQEETNFLRLAHLLIRIAPRAVRQRFDLEFHPAQLQQFLYKHQCKINDLTYKKRVINLAQWNLLYPRDSPEASSDKFDVSLMVCLLRNFTDLPIQDNLPLEVIHTTAADISRIKYYRNCISHSNSGEVTTNEFSKLWKSVVEAILRLAPELKSEIDVLMNASFTYDTIDGIRQEMINTNHYLSTLSQELRTVRQKLDTLELGNMNNRGVIQSKHGEENQHNDRDERVNDADNRCLTNHSARRFMQQNHNDAESEHNHIKEVSVHKNIKSISTFSKFDFKKHHESTRTIFADKKEIMQSSQTTRTVTINNNPVRQNAFKIEQKGASTAVSKKVSLGNLATAPTGLSCLFGGPIYGGTFSINISNLPSVSPSPQTTNRRRYINSSQE